MPQKDSLPEYLEMALKAKDILIRYFYDPEFGGTYWSLNADYTPLDTKKQIYAIAFTIYGLAELNRATGDAEALEYAIKLFHAIEEHSFDQDKDGYFEAFTRTWDPIEDMRLRGLLNIFDKYIRHRGVVASPRGRPGAWRQGHARKDRGKGAVCRGCSI